MEQLQCDYSDVIRDEACFTIPSAPARPGVVTWAPDYGKERIEWEALNSIWERQHHRKPPLRTPTTSDGRGPWIQTAPSNTKFYLADPKPAEIRIEDVAFHLAGINRYTGGSRISVAQHCVVAARMARRHYARYSGCGDHLAAKMLVHDSPEAFYGDASSPLKSMLPDYRRVEAIGEKAFEERFELFWTQDKAVKEIDRRVMLTERPIVFSEVHGWDSDWSMAHGLQPFPVEGDDMEPWSPEDAEVRWLEEFHNLLPWCSEW